MKLSTKPRYAVRILAQIAVDAGNGQPASGKAVAAKQGISEAYMEQILIPLRGAGLVTTLRGRSGGYLLNRPASSITLLEIIELFEGRLELVGSSGYDGCGQPSMDSDIWQNLSEVIRREAAAITLDQLAESIRNRGGYLPEFSI